jgi:hypothetical protein
MSIKLMTAVWGMKLTHTDKLVLLALADNANDEGLCWPSIRTLCKKTCLSERGVQASIGRLIETGTLQRIIRNGKSSNFYVRPPQDMHPAHNSPRTQCTEPPHIVHPPPAPGAPRTVKEPSKKPAGRELKKKVEPGETSDEILPSRWHDIAEERGIPDEQIYRSWRRFKDVTAYPYRLENWVAWIGKERVGGNAREYA